MRAISLLLVGLTIFHAHQVFSFSILRELFFPRRPAVTKVRTLNEARALDDAVLHFIALVEYRGYPGEEHNFTTDDGYILSIHRVPNSPFSNVTSADDKPVVLIQHGIFASSDSWVLMGRKHDLVFLLADAGYDVWIGNIRGNSYCRSHEYLTTDDREFWNFSYHEIAVHDVKTMIDYILNHTGKKNLYYIGHSMGSTMIYALLSTMPEYNEKLKVAISLAPVAFWRHKFPPLHEQVLKALPQIKDTLDWNGIYDVAPQSVMNGYISKMFCSDNSVTQPLCLAFFYSVSGVDPQFNSTLFPYLSTYLPAGASTLTVYHYYQNIMSGNFAPFDHGREKNMLYYNQEKPPSYDLEKITAPVVLIYGRQDALVKKEDVDELYRKLPNVVIYEAVSYEYFTHMDFLWATDAKPLLYDRLLEIMKTHDNT